MKNWIMVGVIVNALLVCVGVVIHPTSVAGRDGLLSVLGPSLSLGAYLVAGWRAGKVRSVPGELAIRVGAAFGLAAGLVLGAEILLEYVILPDTKTNITMGWIEYGAAFGLFAIAAFVTAQRSGRIGAGVQAAFWSAVIASLIWLAVLFLTLYVFWGTARQELVFRAEGDYEDFARSGMKDFLAFTLQDLRGASFFHLLLAPVLASLMGLATGGLGKMFRNRVVTLWRPGLDSSLIASSSASASRSLGRPAARFARMS